MKFRFWSLNVNLYLEFWISIQFSDFFNFFLNYFELFDYFNFNASIRICENLNNSNNKREKVVSAKLLINFI